MKLPIFLIVHNQYDCLKRVVESYEKSIKSTYEIEIVFHNVVSFYYETLNYLKAKEEEGYKVYNSTVNNHHSVIDSVRKYLKEFPDCKYVVISDPDIEFVNIDSDIIECYIHILETLNKTSIGPMLEIDDIPDHYWNKKMAVERHSKQFWKKSKKSISFEGKICTYIECNTDTTFQLFRSSNIPKTFPHSNSIRLLKPYSAKHLDWYIDPNNITPCQFFYSNNTTNISHWNNKNWKSIKNCKKIQPKIINNFYIPKVNYIFSIMSDNCVNLNDDIVAYNITSFMYETIFMKKPAFNGNKDNVVVFGAGNVLANVESNSIVWGSGVSNENELISFPKQILSVRGPLTRKVLIKNCIECPEIYGDVALTLPYFYFPQFKKQYQIGIVSHSSEINYIKKLTCLNNEEIQLINLSKDPKEIINNILKCKYIFSSSLYGIIISHAYNIKCTWVNFADSDSNYFEFRDYYGSLNIKDFESLLPCKNLQNHTTINDLIITIENYPNPVFPINTKSIIELCPFITFQKKKH